MLKEICLSVRKLESGYILDTEDGCTIFISQQKLISEIRRILNLDFGEPLNTEST